LRTKPFLQRRGGGVFHDEEISFIAVGAAESGVYLRYAVCRGVVLSEVVKEPLSLGFAEDVVAAAVLDESATDLWEMQGEVVGVVDSWERLEVAEDDITNGHEMRYGAEVPSAIAIRPYVRAEE
jgi:hypothetical protein